VPDRVVLALDVGGSHVKMLTSEAGAESRRFDSGPDLTASEMVRGALASTAGWSYDVVSVGVPSPVRAGEILAEPVNLGRGWVGFDFEAAFGKPTRVVNDAAMQALGSYEGGKMLFLGFGTGMGSAVVAGGIVEPMELGHLPFRKATWSAAVAETVERLQAALEPDYVVLGGGNAKKLDELPPNARLGANNNAFTGAFRLWDEVPAETA